MKSVRYLCLFALSLALLPNLSFATDLAIEKTADKQELAVGDTLTYSLAISIGSFGSAGPTDATVSDMVPSSMTIVSATWMKDHPADGMTAGDCAIDGNNVSCELGSFDEGVMGIVTIVVIPNALGLVLNTAEVSGSINDPQDINDVSLLLVTVTNPLANISPRIFYPATTDGLAPVQVAKGGILIYNVFIRNQGEATANNVVLTHDIPAFFDIRDGRYFPAGFISDLISCNLENQFTGCENSLGTVTCSLPSLEPRDDLLLFCITTPARIEGTYPYSFASSLESPGDSDPSNNELNSSLSIGSRSVVVQNINVSNRPVDVKHATGEVEVLEASSATESKCQSTDQSLCLNGDRFQVEAEWFVNGTDQVLASVNQEEDAGAFFHVYSESSGQGMAVLIPRDLDDQLLYFFNNTDVDVLVKVLDGAESGNLSPQDTWVFASGLNQLEYIVQVTDTQDGSVRHYEIGDTEAFYSIDSGAPKSGSALGLVGFDVNGGPLEAVFVVSNEPNELPNSALKIFENYPNPFNASTTISIEIDFSSYLKMSIVDLSGRLIKILSDGQKEAGKHSFIWTGLDESGAAVASGTYFVHTEANGIRSTRQLLVAR